MKRRIESVVGFFKQEINKASGEVPSQEQIRNMATDRSKTDADFMNALLLINKDSDFFKDESLALFLHQHRPNLRIFFKTMFNKVEFPE